MKHVKKMMALALAMVMVLAMSMTVFAGGDTGTGDTQDEKTISITVNRDSTYAGDATADSRNFTWYRIFTASYGDDFTGNSSGGGYTSTGGPGDVTGDTTHPVSYTATPAVATKLGTINAETHAWTTNSDNKWFDLTYIPGTGNYSVTWRTGVATTSDTAQAAAAKLIELEAYEATGTLTFDSATATWGKDGLEKGYYVLESEAGKNLIAATTDVTVNEKNDYPPLDKTQADEDNTTQTNDDKNVAVGDELTYQVKVTIPKTAKVGDKILVWDKAYTGLEYVANSLTVKANTGNATVGDSDYSGAGAATDVTWQRLITITESSLGKDVIFEFKMKVTSAALTSTDKKNESGLKYGRGDGNKPFPYESTPDKVEYKTYFAGIEKVDGQNASIKLKGVEFTLKEGDAYFPVTKSGDYYVFDGTKAATAANATVVTDESGLIKIRGLDNDKTYTLTETNNPNEGYNMLAEPKTLTLKLDTYGSTSYDVATSYDANATYYTKTGDGDTATYTEATVADADAFAAGTFYTKTETTGSVYDATTADKFDDIVNNKGTILPSTGGIGTTLFYIIGAILVLGAGILLVTRRRMNAN
jgi:fimbrial isopeptide formation D2 family protein/LPXTG-motif cell wall-anchored protein